MMGLFWYDNQNTNAKYFLILLSLLIQNSFIVLWEEHILIILSLNRAFLVQKNNNNRLTQDLLASRKNYGWIQTAIDRFGKRLISFDCNEHS